MTSPLVPGATAPDFALTSDTGETVRLSELRGKTVVLFFYPKDNTSGCTAQACGFRDAWPQIEDANAVVLGISPDGQASHARFRAKFDLPFHLLVDADHAVAEAYGAWGKKSLYGRFYDGNIRSHFVIDPEGRIKDAQVKVSPKNSVERAIGALSGPKS